MKQFFLLTAGFFSSLFSWAQVDNINPNVNWKYVYNFEEPLADGDNHGLEVPLQKGYEYFVSLSFPGEKAITYFQIYDLQGLLVKEIVDSFNNEFSRYHFDVDRTSTYKLFYAMKDPRKGVSSRKVQVTVARRLKIK